MRNRGFAIRQFYSPPYAFPRMLRMIAYYEHAPRGIAAIAREIAVV